MITFRHHVVTIIAVFVALAAGVALGGGPLSELGRPDAADDRADTTQTAAQTTSGFDEAFIAAVGPGLVSGRLSEQKVALVTMPGADETVVTALTEQVAAAGGALTGTYRLAADMTQPSQKSLVDTLGSQVMAQQQEAADPEASTYVRMGQLLAYAAASPDGASPVNGKARGVREAVVGAGLLDEPGQVEERAPLVLVVLGSQPAADGGDAILAGIVEGLASRAQGTVVVGSTEDGADGQLTALRASAGVALAATVDGTDRPAGRTAAVLALARSISTDGGSFGASGADGPVPLG